MFTRRLLLLLSTLTACAAMAAATVEDRSPFRQGMWWDPTRSGHGFEIVANAGDDIMVVWYTYDTSGKPVWYTAQGKRAEVGSPWGLYKHRWTGTRAEAAIVGTLIMRFSHFEKATATWQVDGVQGSWTLEPFVESGTVNEVDLTGLWYDPASSGWGMTVVDQGEVFGAVLYAYDANGAPTWVAGFGRGNGTWVELLRSEGPCPSCASRPVTRVPVGGIDISYSGDTAATVRGTPAIPLAAGLRLDGAQVRQLGRPASTRRADYQLATFARAESLKAFLVAGMENRIYASAGSDFSPAPPSASASPASFSTTNVQEAGVDEADVVKSDGRYVYTITPSNHVYTPGTATSPGFSTYSRDIRVAWVGGGAGLEVVAARPLAAGQGYMGEAGLYVHANTLVTLASGYYYGGWYYSPSMAAETTLQLLDISGPGTLVPRWEAKLSGSLVSSRRIGDRLYVVTRFTPNIPGYIGYASTDAQRATNRALVEAAPLSSLLPSIAVNGAAPTPALGAEAVYAPQLGGTRPLADMVVVSVIDIREARLVQSLAIVGRTDVMYMSTGNLYLASSRYENHPLASLLPQPTQRSLYNTDIHQISVSESAMRVVGTGSIEGYVGYGDKAAFRFGEHDGKLGVVSSTLSRWQDGNANRVTMLQPSSTAPGLLKTISYLPNSSRPQPLGKPNEVLYGTRFSGSKLYAVTFRRIDPLYIVDVANASDPKITGELEIPGFSDYLHPLPNGLLLGFGREARAANNAADGQWAWFQGLQLTLFDVSASSPRELQRHVIGKRGSDSPLFASHHAFSALTKADGTTVFAFPAAVHDGVPSYGGGDSAFYPWQYSGLLHFELRGTTPADARLSQARSLVTSQTNGGVTYPPNGEGSWGQGRSVLFPDASVYVSNGRFWRQDASGVTSGPY
jgi:uncharacterized secreted protein with C-terminal beta-propeller domain